MKIKQSNNIVRTKTIKKLCWVLVVIFSVFGIEVFSKEWNGIIPCVSTRLDAEKILVRFSSMKLNSNIYKYKKSRVHIDYERKDEKDFDKDIVKKVQVYPDKLQTLKKYIKNIPNFHKDFLKTELDVKTTHVDGRAVYRNRDEGFEIWVQKNDEDVEVISSFGYFDPTYNCSK